jgi:dolichyl-phosphate beta-glucosyltransferase
MQGRAASVPRDGPVISLILPTYNPGPILETTLPAVEHWLREDGRGWEVLFVCDGCTDGTPDRLSQWAATIGPAVRVAAYERNRGKGYAVRHGLQLASGQYRLFTDVDLAYGFDDVCRLVDALRAGADVAIGSRLHPDSRVLLPPRLQFYAYRRYLQGRLFSWLVRRLLPVTQMDTQAGLKGISASAVARILPYLNCDGFGFDCEMLAACHRQELRVVEVPVTVRLTDAKSTTAGLGSLVRMFRELCQIRRAAAGWPAPAAAPPVPSEYPKAA